MEVEEEEEEMMEELEEEVEDGECHQEGPILEPVGLLNSPVFSPMSPEFPDIKHLVVKKEGKSLMVLFIIFLMHLLIYSVSQLSLFVHL